MLCKVLSNTEECFSVYLSPKAQIAFHPILMHLCQFETGRLWAPGSQQMCRRRAQGPSLSYHSSHVSASFVFLHLLYGFELPIKVSGAEVRAPMTVKLRKACGNRNRCSRALTECSEGSRLQRLSPIISKTFLDISGTHYCFLYIWSFRLPWQQERKITVPRVCKKIHDVWTPRHLFKEWRWVTYGSASCDWWILFFFSAPRKINTLPSHTRLRGCLESRMSFVNLIFY